LRLHLFDVQLPVKPTGRKLVLDTNTTPVDAYHTAQKGTRFKFIMYIHNITEFDKFYSLAPPLNIYRHDQFVLVLTATLFVLPLLVLLSVVTVFITQSVPHCSRGVKILTFLSGANFEYTTNFNTETCLFTKLSLCCEN
jgi:hypothetical protein